MHAHAHTHMHTHTQTNISYLSLVIKDAKVEKTEIKSFVIFPKFVQTFETQLDLESNLPWWPKW